MTFHRHGLLLLPFVLLSAMSSQPASAGIDRWTLFGPGGGTIRSLVVDPSAPSTLYALVGDFYTYASDDIYRSTDGGVSWRWAGAGIPSFTQDLRQDLAIDPTRPWRLYTVRCGGDLDSVYRSTDRAAHWSPVHLADRDDRIAAGSPAEYEACFIVVAPAGVVYVASGSLLRRMDGLDWETVLEAPVGILSLLVNPSGGAIFAGTGPGGGLWRSIDGGRQFTPVPGLSQAEALAASTTGGPLYAASNGAIYDSVDGGATWRLRGEVGRPVYALAVDSGSPYILYAGHEYGVSVSRDGGVSWKPASRGLPQVAWLKDDRVAVYSLATDPSRPETVYAGTELAGVYQSSNGGRRWRAGSQPGLGGAAFDSVVVDPVYPRNLYALGLDNIGTLWRSTDGGFNWNRLSNAVQRGFYLNSLKSDPYTRALYGSSDQGIYESLDGGISWFFLSSFQGLVIAGRRVLLATDGVAVYRSANGGGDWSLVLEDEHPPFDRTFGSLTIDPMNPSTVYAEMSERMPDHTLETGLYRSLDAGLTWRPFITGASKLILAPGSPDNLYLLKNGMLVRSTNGGATWIEVGPLPGELFTLVVDPRDPEVLLASTTYDGVWRSTDGGATWVDANRGLAERGKRVCIRLYRDWVPGSFFGLPTAGGGIFRIHFSHPRDS